MKKLIDYKNIKQYEPIQNPNNLFEVRFNPDDISENHQMFSEMVVSVFEDEYRLYIIFNDSKYNDTLVHEAFTRESKNINSITIYRLLRTGEITVKQIYEGEFRLITPFKFSYLDTTQFIAEFKIDKINTEYY